MRPNDPVLGPQSLLDALDETDRALANGEPLSPARWTTGMEPLDRQLGGGLRAGDLVLLGGAQGLGKTTFALQVARNAAHAGRPVLYVCYEHRRQDVLERLLALELGLAGADIPSLDAVRDALRSSSARPASLAERISWVAGAGQALESLRGYGSRLGLVTVAGARAGLTELTALVTDLPEPALLVVDYLQKVHVPGDIANEDERVTRVVEGLKNLALQRELPVLAIVAADKPGLGTARTRLHHLRGSTALAYEADVALLLNDKHAIVARHHLMYGTTNADVYRQYVVCSIEKNRGGPGGVDLEFRAHLESGCFDPGGRHVAEQLVEEGVTAG